MLIQYRLLLPIFIHASPILIHALPILIHLLGFRLSAAYLNTCIACLNTLSPLPILIHALHDSATNQNRTPFAVGSQSLSSITSPEPSANQNRALRHRELSARREDPSRLSARYSLSQYMRVFTPLPPQLTLLLLTCAVVQTFPLTICRSSQLSELKLSLN